MLRVNAVALLISSLCASISVVSAAGETSFAALNFDSDQPQRRRCKFNLEGFAYDLCPLLEGEERWTVESKRETPPTVTRLVYDFSLKSVLPAEDLDDDERCPEGTWACMHSFNVNPHHDGEKERIVETIPVAGVIPSQAEGHYPGLNITAKLSKDRQNKAHDILHLHLHGGWYVDRPQTLDIQLHCDHSAEEPTSPSYYYTWNGTHALSWRTKHACGTKLAMTATETATPIPTETPPEQDNDAPPDDEGEEGAELLDPGSAKKAKRITWFVLLSSASVVAAVIYIIYYPPRPVRRRLAAFLRSHPSLLRFRVGERVLIRWAEEDMDLSVDDYDEDLMVNGGERDPLFFIEDDEQIPLKPSPRKGRHIHALSYGSAS